MPERGNLRGVQISSERVQGFWDIFTALAAPSGTTFYEMWIDYKQGGVLINFALLVLFVFVSVAVLI